MKQPGSQPVDTLQVIERDLVKARPVSFAECVQWARLEFQEMFYNSIEQLLFNFPHDRTTQEG
jgi:ubiquitin-activating enzyme E1